MFRSLVSSDLAPGSSISSQVSPQNHVLAITSSFQLRFHQILCSSDPRNVCSSLITLLSFVSTLYCASQILFASLSHLQSITTRSLSIVYPIESPFQLRFPCFLRSRNHSSELYPLVCSFKVFLLFWCIVLRCIFLFALYVCPMIVPSRRTVVRSLKIKFSKPVRVEEQKLNSSKSSFSLEKGK